MYLRILQLTIFLYGKFIGACMLCNVVFLFIHQTVFYNSQQQRGHHQHHPRSGGGGHMTSSSSQSQHAAASQSAMPFAQRYSHQQQPASSHYVTTAMTSQVQPLMTSAHHLTAAPAAPYGGEPRAAMFNVSEAFLCSAEFAHSFTCNVTSI